jgi:hypothetical protein
LDAKPEHAETLDACDFPTLIKQKVEEKKKTPKRFALITNTRKQKST